MIPVHLRTDSRVMAHRIPIIALCLFAMWCLWWLGVGAWHCFPNAEDLSLSVEAIEKGFLGSIQGLLTTYDGRYFTNALHALNPLVWGWFIGYQLMPAIGILLFTLSSWFLLSGLSTEKNWSWKAMLLSVSYLTVHLSVAPSLSHDLYWMVSSFVYMWPWAFFFLFLGSMLRYFRTPEGMLRNMWFLLCAASLICGIGMNEMFLVLYSLILMMMAHAVWQKGVKTLVSTAPLLIIGVASIAFFVSSPGIGHRLADQEVVRDWHHVFDVISVSSVHLRSFIWETWFGNFMVLPWTIVASIAVPSEVRTKLSGIPWLRVSMYAVIGLCCLWAMTWAYYWPMGADSIAPRRVQTSLLYGLQIWTWGLMVRLISDDWFRSRKVFDVRMNSLIPSVLALVMCGDVMFSNNNITEIRKELSNGTLAGYREQMLNRHQVLEGTSRTEAWNVAVVPPVTHFPTTVFDPPLLYPNRHQDYWNKAYERYYLLDEVRLTTDTVTKLGILLSHGQE